MKEFQAKSINTIEQLLDSILTISNDEKLEITKAYKFVLLKHAGQFRKSGKSYIEHCLTVAFYVSQLNLDYISVIAALLHDTIDKADTNVDILDEMFGTDVAFIVSGLSDVRSFSKKFDSKQTNSEFKHLIMNSSEDIRIIIIRICEKLEGILSIDNLTQEDQTNAAKKILNIYAPLAEYLNLGIIQRLLEDSAFKIVNSNEYHQIFHTISKIEVKTKSTLTKFEARLSKMLNEYSFTSVSYSGRIKGIYSAYKKLKRKNIPLDNLEELKDFFAYRVIVESVEQCYILLGLIHSAFSFSQDDFDDYISVPKENGYQSIHTVVEFEDIFIEIQIRTKQMHEHNEYGAASHIAYKAGNKKGEDFSWAKDISVNERKERDYKVNVFKNSVFVFTPKGLVLRLQKNSTVLDFAFKIHTGLGIRYRGALVNDKMVSIDHVLETGDVVKVINDKHPNATSDWIKKCESSETKRRIRRYLKHKLE